VTDAWTIEERGKNLKTLRIAIGLLEDSVRHKSLLCASVRLYGSEM
jgi:hypothetical protein